MAARAFRLKMGALLAKQIASVCEALSALDAMQVMSGHFIHFLSAPYEVYRLSNMCGQTPFSVWSPV